MQSEWDSVVFVDLDGTVMRGPFEAVVFPAVCGELAEKAGLDIAEARRLVVRENFERQADPHCPASLAMDWDDIVQTVARRLGVRLEARPLELVRAHAGPPYSAVLDEADAVLRDLARPGRAIVAATKGLAKYQLPILEALGLLPLFNEVLTPDSHNALKRERAFYGDWPAQSRVQISVGDLYEDDVAPPKSFGFRAVWKTREQSALLATLPPLARPAHYRYREDQMVRPDAIIATVRELPQVVEEIEALY